MTENEERAQSGAESGVETDAENNTENNTETEQTASAQSSVVSQQEERPSRLSFGLRVLLPLLSALPLIIVGAVLGFNDEVTPWASRVILVTGILILSGGLYFGFFGTQTNLELLPGERYLVLRRPSMKPAFTLMILSLPFFVAAGYLLFTEQSYPIYYFVLFLVAVYLYFRGIIRYWLNHHVAYYVTDWRVVRMRRFLSLYTTEIPVRAINSISETRSFAEVMSGRGSVLVASGIGNLHKIRLRDIDDPGPVARTIRQLAQ